MPNIQLTGIPEGEGKGIENVFEEIMAENFPNLTKKRYSSTGCTEGSQTS